MIAPPDSPIAPDNKPTIERNRREVIRFASDEDCVKALQVLMDLGESHPINSYEYDPNEWWVWTRTVRRLSEFGVPFKWLTENI